MAIEFIESPFGEDIDSVKLSNAIFDEIVLSSDSDIDYFDEYPDEWTDDIQLHSTFNGTIIGGGIDFKEGDSPQDAAFLIKRRLVSDIAWDCVGYVPGNEIIRDKNFVKINYTDKTTIPNEEYEYMVVPMLYGIETTGSTTEYSVKCTLDGLVIEDQDISFYTILEAKLSGITQNSGTTVVNPFNSKYAYAFKGGEKNYVSGTATGMFVPGDICDYDYSTSNNTTWRYRKYLREWLCNGKPKILKYYDGRNFIVTVNGEVQEDDSEHISKNIVTFNWSEIGSLESTNDLYENGFINYYSSDDKANQSDTLVINKTILQNYINDSINNVYDEILRRKY